MACCRMSERVTALGSSILMSVRLSIMRSARGTSVPASLAALCGAPLRHRAGAVQLRTEASPAAAPGTVPVHGEAAVDGGVGEPRQLRQRFVVQAGGGRLDVAPVPEGHEEADGRFVQDERPQLATGAQRARAARFAAALAWSRQRPTSRT